MAQTIRISDEVYKGLKELASPFTDKPNDVIYRLLIEKGVLKEPENMEREESRRVRTIKSGSLTSQPIYENFLLITLDTDFNGRTNKKRATQATLEKMKIAGLLTEADMEVVSTGESKCENTIAWGRNKLKDRGLISKDSPRGIWELTSNGKAEAKKLTESKSEWLKKR